jgi:putative flippase GtrA
MTMYEKLKSLYQTHTQLAHYLIMAVVIVGIEFSSYVLMVWLGVHYLLAVPLSMAIGIVLNWLGSSKLVFKNRRHAPHKEFMLVLMVSLVGVGFQMVVTYVIVDILNQLPAAGKLLAIFVTFFWNFWARKTYIY